MVARTDKGSTVAIPTGIPDEMGGKYKGSTRFGGSRYGGLPVEFG